ncbi:hypothetical protein ABZZ80_32530, partial [Streptomyces sp. NPDC006356]
MSGCNLQSKRMPGAHFGQRRHLRVGKPIKACDGAYQLFTVLGRQRLELDRADETGEAAQLGPTR